LRIRERQADGTTTTVATMSISRPNDLTLIYMEGEIDADGVSARMRWWKGAESVPAWQLSGSLTQPIPGTSYPGISFYASSSGSSYVDVYDFEHADFNEGSTPTYALTTSVVGSGTVTRTPDAGVYDESTVVTAEAVPAAGWSFTGWSGDLTGTTNPNTVTMDAAKTVTATFTEDSAVPPGNLAGSQSPAVTLTWDDDGGPYTVRRDTVIIASAVTAATYIDTAVTVGTYAYTVEGVGAESAPVSVTVAEGGVPPRRVLWNGVWIPT